MSEEYGKCSDSLSHAYLLSLQTERRDYLRLCCCRLRLDNRFDFNPENMRKEKHLPFLVLVISCYRSGVLNLLDATGPDI